MSNQESPDLLAENTDLRARVTELEGVLADQGRCMFLHGPAETHEDQAVRAMRGHAARERRIAVLEAELQSLACAYARDVGAYKALFASSYVRLPEGGRE